jgi:hypothetical protein
MNTNTLPATLNEVAQKSGLEISKAEKYALPYAPLLSEITTFANEVKTLDKTNAEHVLRAKRISLDLGKLCSKATEIKKSDKSELLTLTRYLDGLFNTTEGAARLTQGEANEIVNHAAKIEAERIEAIRINRWNELSQWLEVEPTNLGEMDETIFTNLVFGAKATFEAKQEAERIERERIEAERLAEIERQKAIEAENAKLKAEAEAQRLEAQRLAKIEAEKQAKIQAQLEKERAEAKAKQDAIQAEADRKAREEKAKQDAILAQERAEKQKLIDAENARLAEIEKQRIEAEKLAKAPIQKQLTAWVDGFEIANAPIDNEVSKDIQAKFNAFKAWAKTQIQK